MLQGRITLSFAILMMFVAAPAASSAQTLGTYDNFNAARIDPVKWRGQEQSTSGDVSNTEISRRIVANQLQLSLTTHGGTDSDTGITGDGRNRLIINHPALVDGTPRITVMQATVRVNAAIAEDCTTSDSASRARAQLLAFFFNDGTGNAVPGDLTGDILAGIQLHRDARSGDRITAFMNRCSNATCTPSTTIKSATFSRTWTSGVPETLTVKWQPTNDRFLFVAKSGTDTETEILTYNDVPLADSVQAKGFLKDLRINNSVVNCTGGPVEASMDARFDNVRLNATAVGALAD